MRATTSLTRAMRSPCRSTIGEPTISDSAHQLGLGDLPWRCARADERTLRPRWHRHTRACRLSSTSRGRSDHAASTIFLRVRALEEVGAVGVAVVDRAAPWARRGRVHLVAGCAPRDVVVAGDEELRRVDARRPRRGRRASANCAGDEIETTPATGSRAPTTSDAVPPMLAPTRKIFSMPSCVAHVVVAAMQIGVDAVELLVAGRLAEAAEVERQHGEACPCAASFVANGNHAVWSAAACARGSRPSGPIAEDAAVEHDGRSRSGRRLSGVVLYGAPIMHRTRDRLRRLDRLRRGRRARVRRRTRASRQRARSEQTATARAVARGSGGCDRDHVVRRVSGLARTCRAGTAARPPRAAASAPAARPAAPRS